MSYSDLEKDNTQVELHSTFSKQNIQAENKDTVLDHIVSFNGEKIQITGDVDEAMLFALDAEDIELSEEDAKKLLRKIDIYLLPLISMLYCFQYMDKVTSSAAAIMGFREYYNMKGDMYSWVGSAFYFGYLFFEFPVSAALQRFPVAKTTSIFIIIWGVILCLHSVAANYAGILVLRTLLGAFEASVTPAMVIITGQWYKKEEQFLRTAIWFSFNGLGTILSSSIAYGLAKHAGSYSMEAWRLLFIITGCMTVAIGFAIFFHVPDVPAKAWWLNETEKKQTVLRIKSNQQGFGNKHFKWHQFKEALLDINTWIYFFIAVATCIPNGALTNFGAILLKETFGYSSTQSLLMNMPGGAVQIIGCPLFGYLVRWVKHRLAISIITLFITLAASCMLAFAMNSPDARLAGYYLFFLSPVTMICALSCFSSNVAGHTKKITVNAIYLIGYCVGNLIGPQTFIAAQAPEYKGGQIAMVVSYCATLVLVSWLYYNYWAENKKRDRLAATGELVLPKIENIEFADLTDLENTYFRYQL